MFVELERWKMKACGRVRFGKVLNHVRNFKGNGEPKKVFSQGEEVWTT
jgi:hypothetical protein